MKEINITGQKREALGKKASKQYRKEGLVPCNIYGEKKCENGRPVAMSFVAPMSELRKLVYTPHIYVVNLIIDGESHPAIMKELQFHPVTDALLHIDFYEVNDQKPIVMGVPVKLQGLAAGVRAGAGGGACRTVRHSGNAGARDLVPVHDRQRRRGVYGPVCGQRAPGALAHAAAPAAAGQQVPSAGIRQRKSAAAAMRHTII